MISLTNPLNAITTRLAKAAESISDNLGLPEAFGDAVKLAIGVKTGNVELIKDAVEDLSDNFRAFLDPKKYVQEMSLRNQEPSPPPLRCLSDRRPMLTSNPAPAPSGGYSGIRATPTGPSLSTAAPAAPAPSTADSSAATANTATDANGSKTGEVKGKEAAQAFMAKFPDPESFMEAIKNGDLPPEVANSQTGMMMIQQRLHEIQRMFQLMTQMMQAMHEMEMAIVRNIRA
jgi:hypothetical protein